MSEMFHLGFEIDTRPLAQASSEATKAADAMGKLGTAEQKLAADSQKAAQGLKQTTDEASKAAKAAQEASSAKTGAAKSAKDYEEQLQKLTGTLKLNQQDMAGLVQALRGGSGLVGGFEAAGAALARFGAFLGPVGLGLGLLAVAGGTLGKVIYDQATALGLVQDKMGLFDARLKNALGSSVIATDTMKKLFDATQKTGLGFQDTADAFLRIARNGDRLGATTEQLLQLTDTIQKLGAVSGASKGEIGSGMLQLSQALASGKLNGDELRSIMENMPALAKAIADGLGVGVGQMRAMGAAGELTSEKVFKAILKSSSQANKEFEQLPDTIERANQRIADAMDKLMATLGERWNASGFVRSVKGLFLDVVTFAQKRLESTPLQQQLTDLQNQRARLASPNFGGERNNAGAIAALDKQIDSLRAGVMLEAQQRALAEQKKADEVARAPILGAQDLGASEYDDYAKKLKKATEDAARFKTQLDELKKSDKFTQAEKDLMIPALTRYLQNANAEVADLIAGLDRAKRDLSDSKLANLLGGGGGGVAIVAQAQQQMRAAASKGGGSLQQFMDIGIQQAVLKGEDQIATLERQIEAQRRMASAVGMTRKETIEFEVANEVMNKRFELFGTLTGPGITKWAEEYANKLRRVKEETDATANATARLNLQEQIALATAQLGAIGNPYEQRRLAMLSRRAQMARTDPVRAAMMGEEFNVQEDTTSANMIYGASRNAAFNRSLIGLSPGAVREAELRRRIEDAQLSAQPGSAGGIEAAFRAEDESQRAVEYDKQTQALERQVRLIQERAKLNGLVPDEYRVQNALLTKRNELEAAGAPQEVIDRQIQITEQLERQAIAQEKTKARYDGIINVAARAADNVGDAFRDALAKGMEAGGKAGINQLSFGFRQAVRRMGAEMAYEIGVRPFIEALRNMAMVFGQRIATSIFGGGGFGGNLVSVQGVPNAMGNAYGYGGVHAFAGGGAFTNGIYDSPTMFRFANGGALGVMGEAGPEAVMPLTRGSNGKLGVQATGGDVQVVINDMRSNASGESIKVAQSRGPDNRRILQVMVRDEVKRSLRSGQLDTEMFNNFGVGRSVARK